MKKQRLTVIDVLAIGGAVVRSIGRVRQQIEAAKDPDSPGGVRVTPPEAVRAVVGGLLDVAPMVYQRATGEDFPEDLDLLEAIAEL